MNKQEEGLATLDVSRQSSHSGKSRLLELRQPQNYGGNSSDNTPGKIEVVG